MNTTAEAVPNLGLAELSEADLPHLEVVVRNAKLDIVANVGAQLVALIVSPHYTSKRRAPATPARTH
jgi:hypothetical protein